MVGNTQKHISSIALCAYANMVHAQQTKENESRVLAIPSSCQGTCVQKWTGTNICFIVNNRISAKFLKMSRIDSCSRKKKVAAVNENRK